MSFNLRAIKEILSKRLVIGNCFEINEWAKNLTDLLIEYLPEFFEELRQ
jgi:hypothetical protein